MFQGCSSLEVVDVSRWDVSMVEDMDEMFSGCSSLKEIDLRRWKEFYDINIISMFDDTNVKFIGGKPDWIDY